MPTISFNITAAQGQLLLDAFNERHPGYGLPDFVPPPAADMADLAKAKYIIAAIIRDYLRLLKQRQALATVDDSGTELAV